ncbi:U4/U6.U5 small nuclear ribonucleoprotein 27 kDa protein [Phytophthora cinnamomi]|uniref:U4/U6.U5 small nuclear ribonucleoprotein 27 kDa protein n=1 Tax=Phytophthora cinnamomi TaxID=4785 RepID=UPI00355ABD40|nr:U4/U6.U5 small nuclear ribonucleoprotein 27 kDa protein [Phytophthora cinnamomi]
MGRRRRRDAPSSSRRRRRSVSASRSRSRSRSPPRNRRRRERRSRSRSRSVERRRRRRSYSRSRSRSRSRGRRSTSRSTSRRANGTERVKEDAEQPKPQQVEEVNALSHLSEEEQMQMLLGFGGFDSTKGKAVEENVKSAAVGTARRENKREYRQYMNRRGGFNRPLDKS